ncbi:MAG: FG-GAP-like repeat-containing protein [Polyangiaceae bacterium]
MHSFFAARRALLSVGLALGIGASVLGCSAGPEPGTNATPRGTIRGTSPLVETFRSVAEETGVPVEYLVGVAYVQTRFSTRHTEPSAWGGRGVMQLVERRSLSDAARLTGLGEDELSADTEANVHGAARVLSELRDRHGSWEAALQAYGPGEISPEAGLEFARRVIRVAVDGVRGTDSDGLSIVFDGAYAGGESVGQQSSELKPDYSGANWVGPACSGNYSASSRGASDITDIVIHTCQGGFSGCWGWLKNCASGVSAHYVVSSGGEVVQLVEENDVAYHDACFNTHSVGIEHEGFIDDPNKWFTDAMYCSSAKLVRSICDRNNIPCDRAHVRGHGETPDCSDHTDPGSGWDWGKFMEYVKCGCGGCCNAASETCNGKDDNCNGEVDEGDVCEVDWLQNELSTYAPPSTSDVNGDGKADVCGRGYSGVRCHLAQQGGWTATSDTKPGWGNAQGWDDVSNFATFRMGDVNGDGFADLCARANDGVHCALGSAGGLGAGASGRWYGGMADAGSWNEPRFYTTIRLADVNGDGLEDLCGRSATSFECHLSDGESFSTQFPGPALSDENGWGHARNYGTIRMGDINGDGKSDVCARANAAIACWLASDTGFSTDKIAGPAWSNDQGWDKLSAWSTIRLADVNGDGRADLCGKSASALSCALSNGNGFEPELRVAGYSDDSGWGAAPYFSSLRVGDVDGDGAQDLCVRASTGVRCHVYHDGAFEEIAGPAWNDDAEWKGKAYYSSFALADVNGDGLADWCGRGVLGWRCALATGVGFDGEWTLDEFTDEGGWDALQYRATVLSGGPPSEPVTQCEAELCNGRDDDCDGEVDEDCAPVGSGGSGSMNGGAGAPATGGSAGDGLLHGEGIATRDSGCGCRTRTGGNQRSGIWILGAMIAAWLRRRRR